MTVSIGAEEPEIVVVLENNTPDIIVVNEVETPEPEPEVVVVLEDNALKIDVTLSEVSLAGPQGPMGPSGDGSGAMFLDSHINSATPHPVYDDGPSFALLYQNAKV